MRFALLVFFVFIMGFVLRHLMPVGGGDVATHWAAVEEYNEYMRDPSNYKRHPSGLASTSEPFKIEPHLAHLVAEDELVHDDIVLPNVTESREMTKYRMAFCEENHKEIVWVTSLGYPDENGPRPVHLNLWYKPSAQWLVDQLIEELKAMGSEKK